ncbi:MAG: DUF2062 domain-containing protein [Gammaproteobacteria bacterium]|nr:MAG: DUF2062 domain-containing protein [Gammaproteobacteria bacterium]
MPRKIIQKWLPEPDKIKEHKYLKWLGSWLHNPALWHLHRRNVARAFAIGLFCAWVPVPMQMVLAAIGAVIWRANLPLAVVLVWLTNPLTMPPMFYGAYELGKWLLGRPDMPFQFELSMTWLTEGLLQVWEPFLLGCAILGTLSAVLGYFVSLWLWRWHVTHHWHKRRQ